MRESRNGLHYLNDKQRPALAAPRGHAPSAADAAILLGVVNGLLNDLPKRRRRVGSLSDPDISLAGYLLSKAVIGDPVEPQDIPRLHKANNTVQETRARFPYGRGNVATDIAVSDHASSQHAQAAHDVFVDLVRGTAAGVNAHESDAGACGHI